MCMIDDADPMAFVFQQTPQARKPHVCSECNRTIQPNETYTRSSVGFENTVKTYKMCAQCKDAADWLEYHCGGWCYGSIKEELEEHYFEGYREDGLQSLLIGIRRGWKAFDGDGLLEVKKSTPAQPA